MSRIKKLKAREVLDSRGNPTVEVDVFSDSLMARAIVPSGASTGIHEALELRDGDKRRFFGKGVLKAVNSINTNISKALYGRDPSSQEEIDGLMIELDNTENKSGLGANAVLAVSMAVCRLGALEKDLPLYEHISRISGNKKLVMPVPCFNVINGGKHAGNKLDVQEFMINPVGAKNFHEALRMGAETYHTLKGLIKEKYGKNAINVGDEGGFAPPINTMEDALEILTKAIKKAGYNNRIKIGLDCAASEFYDAKTMSYKIEGKKLKADKLMEKYLTLIRKYPIISIEDPFGEDDFHAWKDFMDAKKKDRNSNVKKVQVVGDDLLVTNIERINIAHIYGACNSLLLKVNQIGSVTEAIEASLLAKTYDWKTMVSHRSGETEDTFIADLVVGLGTGQIKSGAPCRAERTSKYNQLLRIEEELGNKVKFNRWK